MKRKNGKNERKIPKIPMKMKIAFQCHWVIGIHGRSRFVESVCYFSFAMAKYTYRTKLLEWESE